MARVEAEWLQPGRYPFRCRMTTRFADMDPNGHVNNVAMAAAFEDARVRFDASNGLEHGHDSRTMIVSNDLAYLAEAHYPEPLDLLVGVEAVGRTSWTLVSLAMQGERICAFSRAVLVGTVAGAPAPLAEPFRRKLIEATVLALS